MTAMIEEKNDQNQKPTKKPLIYYAMIASLIIMLLNIFLFPRMLSRRVEEVSYDKFLSMIDNGEVTEVAYDAQDSEIIFATGSDIRTSKLYSTGIWPDDGQRLLEQLRSNSSITFSAEIPTKQDPLVSFIVSWVLPIAFFMILGEILNRQMMKRMKDGGFPGGGNFMSFGKADAKVYVTAQTGKTFADVAGQDEAKDALKEVVDFLHRSAEVFRDRREAPEGRASRRPSPAPVRRFSRRRSPVRPRCRSSRSPAQNLSRCLSAWAPRRSATSSSRRTRRLRASCSSTRSTL